MSKPNKQDLEDWYKLCEWLSEQPRKSTYSFSNSGVSYLHSYPDSSAVGKMRKWMKDNKVYPIFYSSGWGYRLRKNWKEMLESIENM